MEVVSNDGGHESRMVGDALMVEDDALMVEDDDDGG
jgi:hypothetical protein